MQNARILAARIVVLATPDLQVTEKLAKRSTLSFQTLVRVGDWVQHH